MVPSSLEPRVSPERMLCSLSWWRCLGQEMSMVAAGTGEGPGADALLSPPNPRVGLGQGWLTAGTSCPCVGARGWLLGKAAGQGALLEGCLFELFPALRPSSGDCAPRAASCPARGRAGGPPLLLRLPQPATTDLFLLCRGRRRDGKRPCGCEQSFRDCCLNWAVTFRKTAGSFWLSAS